MATTNTNFKVKNGLDAGGDITTSGYLKSTNSSGDEGGEIFLNKSVTNTTINTGVTIDVYQNKLRFFEQGGTARGFYIDITTGGASVGTNLVSGGSYTLPAATSTALGGIELFSDTQQTVVANSVSSTASRTYGLQVNSSGQGVVNVPWTDWYPTTFTYTGGTTAGPTGSLTGSGMSAVSFAALPSASASASGIVTTAAQEFAGVKTLTSPSITTSLTTTSTTFSLANTTATTINFGGAATTMNIATNDVAKTINIGTGATSGNTTTVNLGTSASATTSNINLYGQTTLGKPVTSTTTVSGFGTTLLLQGTSNTGTTGNATGADLLIRSGSASITNASNTGGTATSGNISIDSGTSSHAYFDGTINPGTISIGTLTASSTTIGRSGATTTINGDTNFGSGIVLPAGTSSRAPIDLAAGTNLSTSVYGAVEAATDGIYITNNPGSTSTGPGRGVILAPQMVFSLANSSTSTSGSAVSVFASANDVLSVLEANKLYRFRAKYYSSFTYAGTSGTISTLFAFSNAPVAIKYSYETYPQTAGTTTTQRGVSTVTTATTIVPSQAASGTWVTEIDGYFTTHATLTSTLTPQFSQSGASSTTVFQAGSWFEVEKLGTASTTLIAGNWA